MEPDDRLERHEDVTSAIRGPDGPPAAPSRTEFEQFYRAHYADSLRLAWLLTHSSTACEDLVQESFVAVYQRFHELDAPLAYLRRTLANRCHSWIRGEMVRRRRRAIDATAAATEMPLPQRELLAAVQRLPYRQRVVLVARYWADWSEAEIAAALNCRPGTVKSLTSRALARLQKELG